MRRHSAAAFAFALCAVCVLHFAAAWTPQCRAEAGPDPSGAGQKSEMLKRRDAILAEIEGIKSGAIKPAAEWGAEWAGEYYGGNGINLNKLYYIAPNAGFACADCGPLGPCEFFYGDIVEATPEGIRVRLEQTIDPEQSLMSEWFYFIEWGDHRLLLSEPELIRFITSFRREKPVALPAFPTVGGHSMVCGGEKTPPGQPVFPRRFRPLLDLAPIHATVTEVKFRDINDCALNGYQSHYYEIRFDKGRLDDVLPLTHIKGPWNRGGVVIQSLDDHSAVANVTVSVAIGDRSKEAVPQVGDILSIYTAPPEALAP